MILMLNNRDSFVFNLARYFAELGREIEVVDSDRVEMSDITRFEPEAIIVSPGPGTPADAGISMRAIREFGEHLPILGVCLGHQAIAAVFGWPIVRARSPAHGRTIRVRHSAARLFRGLPEEFGVGLYHSLIAEPPETQTSLLVDAVSPAGEVMAVSDTERPVYGIQFHPESILTEHGSVLLQNFLGLADEWGRR